MCYCEPAEPRKWYVPEEEPCVDCAPDPDWTYEDDEEDVDEGMPDFEPEEDDVEPFEPEEEPIPVDWPVYVPEKADS